MTSYKLATYATSECLPAGHGNVCVSFHRDRRMIECAYLYHPAQSTQCKVSLQPPLILYVYNIFIDYAINNKLTPFISMQNHYNLIYREEEREMFPTLKVRTTPLLFFFKFFLIIVIKINNILSTWASVRFPGPLLLAVFLRVLMEIILRRSAHRVMGTNINFINCELFFLI
jgi:hypothetical protein